MTKKLHELEQDLGISPEERAAIDAKVRNILDRMRNGLPPEDKSVDEGVGDSNANEQELPVEALRGGDTLHENGFTVHLGAESAERDEQVWNVIEGDKQLRGILAQFALGDFNERDAITADALKVFRARYKTRQEFEQDRNPMEAFLRDLFRNNDEKKFNQYLAKIKEFKTLVWG